jgi:hypothetical protein
LKNSPTFKSSETNFVYDNRPMAGVKKEEKEMKAELSALSSQFGTQWAFCLFLQIKFYKF